MSVSNRVLNDVAEQPRKMLRVADRVEAGLSRDPDLQVVGRQRGDDVPKKCADVHRPQLGRQLLLVGLGEQQQLIDELLQPGRLLHRALGDDRPGRDVRVGEADLERGGDRGERAAQFMGRVGDKAALRPARGERAQVAGAGELA